MRRRRYLFRSENGMRPATREKEFQIIVNSGAYLKIFVASCARFTISQVAATPHIKALSHRDTNR